MTETPATAQAYHGMLHFHQREWERTSSDDFAELLSGCAIDPHDGRPMDPAEGENPLGSGAHTPCNRSQAA